MADAPPFRAAPLPSLSALPVSPIPAKTDVQPVAAYVDEDTSSLHAPDAAQLVEQVLELIAGEAAALLAGDHGGERLADLNVRTALASWETVRTSCDRASVIRWPERKGVNRREQA